MSFVELIEIILGTILEGLFILSPFILPMTWPYVKQAIYKLACYMTDGPQEYDSNGNYISRNK